MNEKVAKIMKALQVDEQTALEIIESDARIDKGEPLFELTSNQKKVEKEMRGTGTRTQTVYKFDKRTRRQYTSLTSAHARPMKTKES